MQLRNSQLSFLLFFGVCLFWQACVPPTAYNKVEIDMTDPVVQRIFTLQDQQHCDSMLAYFRYENPAHRRLAALALGSANDSTKTYRLLDSLGKLLKDPFEEVRAAAAFSLGQIGSPKSEALLIKGFDRTDTTSQFSNANATILEAIGRCGSLSSLQNMAGISTFKHTDSALICGQALGLLRFGLRNMSSPESNATQLRLLKDEKHPEVARIASAYYFARLEGFVPDSQYLSSFVTLLSKDKSAGVRMSLAKSMGNSQNPIALAALTDAFKKETDARVRVSLARALGKQPYAGAQATLLAAVRDPDLQVALTAAQFFVDNGQVTEAEAFLLLASDNTLPKEIQSKMYGATLAHTPYKTGRQVIDSLNLMLQARFGTETDPYAKADILHALSAFPYNYAWIYQQGSAINATPIIKTTAIECLKKTITNPAFPIYFKGRNKPVRDEIFGYLLTAMRSKDVGSMAVAAEIMRDPAAGYLPIVRDSILFLSEAQKQLKLPRDLETYNAIQQTINAATGATTPDKVPDNNNPIDWSVLATLTPVPQAVVVTTKGSFTIDLDPQSAPATVASFAKLVKQGFFTNKAFHRVVGNFVAQTGCPRGDGYGSTDFSLRSEFSLNRFLKEGGIGMASVGPHTESCQWFATLSPALHLDGRYTWFGQISSGMDVVQKLKIGDTIKGITLQ